MFRSYGVLALIACAAGFAAFPAQAQQSFAGKTLTVITSTGAGGAYDASARSVARHMHRHLPGQPNMIVQNMPGGGHMLATNYMYSIAPKDGTAIAVVNQSVPAHQVLDGRGVRYDATKFNWLGALGDRNQVLVVWHESGISTFQDLKVKTVNAGATGEGSSGFRYPNAMNNVLGTKINIVKGYKTSTDIELSIQRGEVNAHAQAYSAYRARHPGLIREKKIRFIVQFGLKRDSEMADVPLWTEVAATEEQKKILNLVAASIPLGRPFLAPPGVPLETVAVLRNAFQATLTDPAFVSDATKQKLEVLPMSGEEVTQIVADTIGASPDVVAKAKAAMRGAGKAK